MNYPVPSCYATGKIGTFVTLLAGLFLGPLQAHGAKLQTHHGTAEKSRASRIENLGILAKDRARKCINEISKRFNSSIDYWKKKNSAASYLARPRTGVTKRQRTRATSPQVQK